MKAKKITLILSSMIIIAILILSACDKRVIELPNYTIQSISAFPDSLYADNDNATKSEIRATVVDNAGNPLVGETVTFKTLEDSLANITATAVTQSNGVAAVEFLDRGVTGVSTVQATIANSSKTTSVRIIEQPDEETYHFDRITVDPDTIYADNNITYSEIEVLVKDEQNFAVGGQTIIFRASIGNIITSVVTDSSGIAQTTFWDSGEEGVATIEAFIGNFASGISIETTVWIDAVPEIDPDEFLLEINSNDINIDEIMTIRARVKNTLGEYVPDGTIVVFETTKGFFQTFDGVDVGILTQQTTTNGVAQTYFNAGTQADVTTISASISEFIVSEDVTIHPGAPMFMYLRSLNDEGEEQYFVPVNSDENLTIEAEVQDKYHNAVEGEELVTFETTLGTIQPPLSPTDNEGFAFTTFSPGISAGIAEISAVSDSAQALTVVTVTSDDVNSIQFAETDEVNLDVQGVGGIESFELVVYLYDMNGNLIDDENTVYFELLAAPAGTNINNVGFADSTQSVNGQAVVAINSGTASGIVQVKAYTYNDLGIEKSATKTNIVVNSGPPTSIDFSIGGHDSSVDGQGGMGGGIWRVQVGANMTDLHGNPVINGTVVWFSLPEDPSFASIEADASIGNENSEGDSLDGVAFTLMSYEGIHTNESVLIRAETGPAPGEEDNFFDEDYLVLPIQFPWIDIVATPQHVDWTEDNNPEWQHSDEELSPKVVVMVKDGQNNPIDGTIVTFMSTLGTLMDPDLLSMDPSHPSFYEDFFDVTGPENDGTLPGEIIKNVRYYVYECPPPAPDGSPGTATATVTANIVGTQTTNNVTVILHRYVP